jgi:two-component system alkaline phosphatase synthesis response regulator PhoP
VAKILVVSTDVDARELIVFALRYAGYRMKCVSSVEECIEKARQFKPDLILLDAMLSGVNGVNANRKLKSHEITAGIRLLFFKSNSGTDSSSDEKTSSSDEHLLNSISPDQLTDKVNSIMNRYHK